MVALKTTYLFGAGASAQAVPVIGELQRAFRVMKQWVYEHDFQNPRGKSLLMNWLQAADNNTGLYGTIDTYAKKLSFTDQDQLKKTKAGLIVFFLLWQQMGKVPQLGNVRKPELDPRGGEIPPFKEVHPRYLGLVTNYINKINGKFEIDPNVRVITWNYDHQLEKAISLITDHEICDVIQEFKVYPPWRGAIGPGKSRIVHLNGIAGLYEKAANNEGTDSHALFIDRNEDLMDYNKRLLEFICQAESGALRHFNYLTYAWEDDPLSIGAIKEAQEILSDTDILIIVGYSFPTFNDSIDKLLMSIAKKKVKHIFYQDPRATSELLSTRFGIDKGRLTIVDKQLDQFVLPLNAEVFSANKHDFG